MDCPQTTSILKLIVHKSQRANTIAEGRAKKNGGKEPFSAVYIKIHNQCTESRRL